MLAAVLIGFLCVSSVWSVTTTTTTPTKAHHHGTHHPHSPNPSHEPKEQENIKFVYEPHSHMMLVVTSGSCYMFSLTDSERSAIHTDAGIRAVELKLLSQLSTASVTEVTKDQLDHKTVHACGGHVQHFYKETVV